MYFDGHELRERFVGDLKAIADKIRADDSVKDKVAGVLHELMEYMDGTHDRSVSPMTLSFDPMDEAKIKARMLNGEQIIVSSTAINTGEYLSGNFGGTK